MWEGVDFIGTFGANAIFNGMHMNGQIGERTSKDIAFSLNEQKFAAKLLSKGGGIIGRILDNSTNSIVIGYK